MHMRMKHQPMKHMKHQPKKHMKPMKHMAPKPVVHYNPKHAPTYEKVDHKYESYKPTQVHAYVSHESYGDDKHYKEDYKPDTKYEEDYKHETYGGDYKTDDYKHE